LEGKTSCVCTDENFSNIFGLLIAKTVDNKTILRLIGGVYGNIINDAVKEIDENYPGCRMKLLLEHNGSAQKYFIPNGVELSRLM